MSNKKTLTEGEVKHIAKLANLPLNAQETKNFQDQLSETLNYVENLNSVDTKNVESTSQVTGLTNITREDKAVPSLTQEDVLKNAPDTHNGFIKVKAIFNDES